MTNVVRSRVTAADVARAAGVSRATVSFVLNATPGQTISAPVRSRVLAEAARLGYRPDVHARALASGMSQIILVPLPEWSVEYALRQILEEASSALDDAGFSLVTTAPHHGGVTRPPWEVLQPDVVMPIERPPDEQVRVIQELGLKLVLPEGDSVDVTRGVDAQVEHLLTLGHTRLAFAATAARGMSRMNAERLSRAQALCARQGVRLEEAVIGPDNARAVVAEWRSSGVTGVIAFNDDAAAHALGAALRLGLRVPKDIAIVGHDDSPIARMMVPSLSTIQVDIAGFGRYMAARAIAAATGVPMSASAAPPSRVHVVRRESS